MIKREVEIKASPEEIAELLFELDNKEVAKVFSIWKKLFEDEYKRKAEAKEPIWIFDLNHFMMWVIPEMDEDGLDFVRSSYLGL